MHAFDSDVLAALRDGLRLQPTEEVANVTKPRPPHNAFTELKERVQWTRNHAWTYNAALCVLLLLLWCNKTVQHRRRRTRIHRSWVTSSPEDDSASDSSSTLTGTATPPNVKKGGKQLQNDRTPLLSGKTSNQAHGLWRRQIWRYRALLNYQPHPIPIVNKTLPDNGTSLFILAFLGLNLFFALYGIPFRSSMIMVFGDRFAALFVANLPLLYLLAAKNQPIKYLTGLSYEALNIFHRRLGEWMCFLAFWHMAFTFTIYFAMLRPLLGITLWRFISNQVVLMGLLAFASYEILYFASLASFRQRWYEVFLLSHILLQALGLGFLWFHYFTSKPYVAASLAIFIIDRVAFRMLAKSTSIQADLQILQDGETVLLSSNWAIPSQRWMLKGSRSIRNGWDPAFHVFVTAPALSRSAFVQAHPFTIASPAPNRNSDQSHAWFSLLIRAQSGFSRHLLNHAHSHPTIGVRLDGPYGSNEPLELLEDSDLAVFVAGGSGIAVGFPLLWALLCPDTSSRSASVDRDFATQKLRQRNRKVCLIWVIHSQSHRSWIPQERIEELRDWGLDVRIPPPTSEAGRPNVGEILEELVYTQDKTDARMSVVVSGPDALNRDVRNHCTRIMRRGMDVQVSVEKFGW